MDDSSLAEIEIRRSAEDDEGEAISELPEIEFERQPKNQITMKKAAKLTHPLVVETWKALAGSATDQRGIHPPPPYVLNVRVSEAARSRALGIMQALILALEARGHKVTVKSEKRELHGYYPYPRIEIISKTVVTIFDEVVEFGIEERAKRVAKGKGIDLRGKKIVSRQYSFPYDFVPDGQLSLEIHTWGGGLKKRWTESRRVPDLPLNDFIVGLLRMAWSVRQDKIEAERRRQEEIEAEQRREEEKQKRLAEAARVNRARRQLQALEESRRVLRFVRIVNRQAEKHGLSLSDENELGKWLGWMQEYAHRIDPVRLLVSGTRIDKVGIDLAKEEQPRATNIISGRIE